MSITEQLNKLAEKEKALKVQQKKLQKKQLENEQKRKMKFHIYIDEGLFIKIENLQGQTVIVEIRNDENIVEDIEMIVTRKALVNAVLRIIKTAFSDFEFLQEDFE